jgi:hypothetical protein
MYLDHPTATEEVDRPERSVRDLAGTLDTAAIYEKDGLYADVTVYSHWAAVIKEMAEDIGISIRALAALEDGEREGRQGPICAQLIEGYSVDYVTQAGAGGEIVKIMESARKQDNLLKLAGMKTQEALNSNRRSQVQRVLEQVYGGDRVEVWLRDLDEDKKTAYFTIYGEGMARIYSQTYKPASDDSSVTLEDDREEVLAQTQYVPVPTTDTGKPVSESESESAPETPEETRKDAQMGDVTITETEHQALQESSGRVKTLETELSEARKETKDTSVREAKAVIERNRAEARLVVQSELWEAGVKAPALARALSVDPPLVKEGEREGRVDEDGLKKQVKEAIAEITVEVDEAGGVRGFGKNGKDEEKEISESDLDKMSARTFGREVKA